MADLRIFAALLRFLFTRNCLGGMTRRPKRVYASDMAYDAPSRRDFLKWTAGTAAGSLLPSWFAAEEAGLSAEAVLAQPRRIGPNDTIRIAVIGPGGSQGGFRQGLGVTRWMAGKKGVQVTAVCDVDSVHLDEAAAAFPGSKKFKDYRELIAAKVCDAVVIGTPDHWHLQQCVDAMNAGLDVYCEKPLTLAIKQGRMIADVAKKRKRIFQTGSQQRSDGRFRLACELVRTGAIGKVLRAEVVLPTGPSGGPFAKTPVPQNLDWNMWLGPAPYNDYIKERVHGSFRWWLDYSGGMLTDWGAHHFDIALWGLGLDGSGPTTITAEGTPPGQVGDAYYTTFPKFKGVLGTPKGTKIHYTNEGENGVKFVGTDGWIFVNRGKIEASDPAILQEPIPDGAERLYRSDDHVQNFIDGIRTRKECICTAEVGHRSISVSHLINTCLRLGGRPLTWDPAKEVFVNDAEANLFVDRPQRKWD